ncbi:Histone acetyltransferase [Handroanthus impetiginosus]|uniref:Histone acetyltransferase n=1 Tax=Handroanthus impetiginosus TaxID=429701 RepID=A0A2G9HHP1_9LAMI|nr:Histone acetyltransferase [Handroanthus impetiginosus]
MQSSNPSCVEVALSCASDFMNQELSCDLFPGTKDWTKCSICCQHHLDGCGEPFLEWRKSGDDACFLNYKGKFPQLSTSSTMFRNFTPNFVYQRRKQRKNSDAIFTIEPCPSTKPSDGSRSAVSSEAPSLAAQGHVVSESKHATEAVRSTIVGPVECNTVATASSNGCCAGEKAGSEEAFTTHVDRILNMCNANDNCSSSKSNIELSSASLKTDMDDAGECSSSGALSAEKAPEEISEREICISILRSLGLLDRVGTRQDRAATANTGVSSDNYCSKSCKVCKHVDSTLNMLICDNCEDAFHISCYTPPLKILPVGEWLCSSCLKKKHKILKDKSTSNSVNISTEIGRSQCSASEGELGSLGFMFRDTEPYMSSVRIGDEFQADIPDYGAPIDEESDLVGDPLELDPSNDVSMQEQSSFKPLKLSSIGNWVQCREVIEGIGEGVDGTICAKWRRAPLFEVQTDGWECFRCVLWDPAHADCAVPQELDTEEVMKQLKYIEMLRPRLAGKRRKLEGSKSVGSQDASRS